jgi:vesicular inhibitory amino acid transporter
MWTPTTSNDGVINSPALTPKDWRKIKERRQTGKASSLGKSLVNDPPMALQIGSGSINQKPLTEPGELSTKSACWTVLNIFMGLGLLSKPWAFAKGGWIMIPLLAVLTLIANICGKLIVSCFETPKCRGSTSYSDIVDKVFGYWGAVTLIILVAFEWVAAICILLLFIWVNVERLMPGVSRLYIVGISTAVTLPTVWILKLSNTWLLTFLGWMTIVGLLGTMLYLWASYGELVDVDLGNTIGPDIPLSTSIYMLSLSGQSALPQVYREMSKPEDFNWVIDVCFIIMFLVYTIAGVSGYMVYGYSSSIVISTDMVMNPGGVLPKIVSCLVIANNYLTVNSYVAAFCDSSEIMMGIEEAYMKRRVLRSFAFLACAGLAYLAYDALVFVESFSSATCVMITSFILPAVLFLLLKGDSIPLRARLTSSFISFLLVVMTVAMTYSAINTLVHPKA